MSKNASTSSQAAFKTRLVEYKNLIDDDIASYSKHIQNQTLQQFGVYTRMEIDAFLSILARGGKRIRGALVMHGYAMSGGKDQAMIVQAARAVEMIHAYILMIDDIQDRSLVRRGGPAAHVQLAEYHKQHDWAGDSAHFGVSIALNAALSGAHAAQMVLANLDAEQELRIKVLSIMNRTMLITAHGQTGDIINEVTPDVTAEDIDRVLEWKTAHYTFLNPLQVGMVLAGAQCAETTAITDYAMHAGRAFQISDDVLGVFGSEFESGKSPFDDIREGKRTLMMAYAIQHASDTDKNFLIQMLGNEDLTPLEFERCKVILDESGALEFARSEISRHVDAAQIALGREAKCWTSDGVAFLEALAQYLQTRTS